MNKGWIKLHRKIQDCCIWQKNEPFDSRSAWIDLLLLASHKEKKIVIDNKTMIIERGSYMTSFVILSERWKWSRAKTMRFFKLLESEHMVNTKRTSKGTLVTIENYGVFQGSDTTVDTTVDTQNNNVKNIKNGKKEKNGKNIKEKGSYEPKKKNEPYFPDDERLELAFREFLSMRVKTKKPITSKQGMTRMLNKLQQLAGDDNDLAVKILEQSTDHCWTDIYELKTNSDWGRKKTNYNQPIDWDNI